MAETKVGMELSFHRAAWTQLKRQGHSNTSPLTPQSYTEGRSFPHSWGPQGRGEECLVKPWSEWYLESGSWHRE